MLYYAQIIIHKEGYIMEHIKTLNTKNLQNTVKKGGCGECQTSCQSACKTSCTVGNQISSRDFKLATLIYHALSIWSV